MYKFNYDLITGEINSIQNGNMSIPLCEGNTDYQDFLIWNSEQVTPLDLESTIEVVKPIPPRNLEKEIDELKAQVATQATKIESMEAASIKP